MGEDTEDCNVSRGDVPQCSYVLLLMSSPAALRHKRMSSRVHNSRKRSRRVKNHTSNSDSPHCNINNNRVNYTNNKRKMRRRRRRRKRRRSRSRRKNQKYHAQQRLPVLRQ